MFETILSVALGLSLAASCGLRAFMPLLVAGLGARFFGETISLTESFQWLGSTPCLIALTVAVIAEVAADKVPALDHALDVIQAPVRTIAGMVVAGAVMVELPTWMTVLTAVVAGGGAAFGVHAAKATVRVGSTATTGGVANPVISIFEDVACLLSSVLSVVFAVFAVIVCILVVVFIVVVVRKVRQRLKDPEPAGPEPAESA